MKALLRHGWPWGALLCAVWVWVPGLRAQPGPPVAKVELKHVGPPAVSEDLIRANIHVRVGEPYNRQAVDDDVRNLYATGYFFQIRVTDEITPQGMVLTYFLQGKPVLTDIRFQGNTKYDNKKLLKKVTSKIGEPLDERKLFRDSQEIQTTYQKAGYPRTTVTYVRNIDEKAGRGTVTFEVTEGQKVLIKDIQFVGATAYNQRKLRKTITTKRRGFFSWITGRGVLKEDQIEEDKDKLSDFYRNEGYIDFEVKEVKFDYISQKKMIMRFMVTEGRQYKVGAVEFKGNTLFTTNELARALKMNVGQVFTPKGMNKDLEAAQDVYGAKGYIDTRVVVLRNANTERGTMDLVYQFEEGEKSYIEKIEIKGNSKTKDRVIRRELAVAPGEVFDMVRVKISKRRLEGLDYFSKVDTDKDPTDVPNRKNLLVGVEEKNTGNLTLGAGFSSIDSVVGYVEVTQGNFDLFRPPYFTGGGQKFRLRASVGTVRQDYQLTFIEPWFLQRKLALGVDLYHREYNFLSDLYDETRTGARLSLTRALGSDFFIGSVGLGLENVGIKIHDENLPFVTRAPGPGGLVSVVPPNVPPSILAENGDTILTRLSLSLAYDTRNHALMPTAGQRTELSGEIAGGSFLSDREFYKIELKSSWYFRGLFEGHVIELTGFGAVADSFGQSSTVPFYERYYLGGLYSLRGFKFRQVGPKEAIPRTGALEPVGGNTYMFGSVEYSIPIIDRLKFAFFYDIGNVWSRAYDFDIGNYNDNWGVGLRLNLPIGPMRFDYGIPITDDGHNGGSGRFNFGIGYSRPF